MKSISVSELKNILESTPTTNLVDVREPQEHTEFNIGGILLPLGQITAFQTDAIDELKNETVYVYCRSGKRSAQACMFLEQAGYTDVINVEGGVIAWQEMSGK